MYVQEVRTANSVPTLAARGARPRALSLMNLGAGRVYIALEIISFNFWIIPWHLLISLALNDTQIINPVFAAQLQQSPNSRYR